MARRPPPDMSIPSRGHRLRPTSRAFIGPGRTSRRVPHDDINALAVLTLPSLTASGYPPFGLDPAHPSPPHCSKNCLSSRDRRSPTPRSRRSSGQLISTTTVRSTWTSLSSWCRNEVWHLTFDVMIEDIFWSVVSISCPFTNFLTFSSFTTFDRFPAKRPLLQKLILSICSSLLLQSSYRTAATFPLRKSACDFKI